jgi:hypothetical protein
MKNLIWEWLWQHVWWIASSFLAAMVIIAQLYKGAHFIATVLSDQRFTWLRAIGKMAVLVSYAPSLLIFRGERFRAARYLVELEILKPRPSKPNRRDYHANPKDPAHPRLSEQWKKDINEWRRARIARRKSIRELIKGNFHYVYQGFWPWIWHRLKRHVLRAKSATATKQIHPVVIIDDFPSLDDSRALIKRYFQILQSWQYEEDATFVSKACFEVGYLAPLFLVTGLINRFGDTDGWTLILDNYRRLVAADAAYSVELRELRSSLFNTWLLWGPGIAPCSCDLWKPRDPSCQSDLTLQYGYGDENNSIDLALRMVAALTLPQISKIGSINHRP